MLEVGDIHSIKRLHYRQRWSKRRIARELGIARNTVRDVLNGECDGQYTMAESRACPVADQIAPIVEKYLTGDLDPQLQHKQRLTAARIEDLLRKGHDYTGSERTVRRVVSKLRLKLDDPLQVAMVPLVYEPGIDAQVDFLEADVDYPEGRLRKTFMLSRACYSTRAFARRVPAENQEALFEALVASFEHFDGLFHNLWFDNLTAAVAKVLKSRARKVQRRFEAFKAHYGFDAEFCAPGKGNEKGGVEKGVSFFRRTCLTPVPEVSGDEELDQLLVRWMVEKDEHTPAGRDRTVGQMWTDEVAHLIPLVSRPFDCGRAADRKVSAYSLVRFENNSYSVPVAYVRQWVTVKCFAERLEIHGPGGVIAGHERLYGRGRMSFELDHYLPLLERKVRAFDRAVPVKAAQSSWPRTYPLLLRVLRDREGEAEGTREFIQVLWLHRHHPAQRVREAVRRALTHERPSYAHVWAHVEDASRSAEPPEALSTQAQSRLPQLEVEVGDVGAYLRLCQEGER